MGASIEHNPFESRNRAAAAIERAPTAIQDELLLRVSVQEPSHLKRAGGNDELRSTHTANFAAVGSVEAEQ